MHVETVADSIVDTLYSGLGKTIYMPGIMRYVAILVMSPSLQLFYTASLMCLRRKAVRIGSSVILGMGRRI